MVGFADSAKIFACWQLHAVLWDPVGAILINNSLPYLQFGSLGYNKKWSQIKINTDS